MATPSKPTPAASPAPVASSAPTPAPRLRERIASQSTLLMNLKDEFDTFKTEGRAETVELNKSIQNLSTKLIDMSNTINELKDIFFETI